MSQKKQLLDWIYPQIPYYVKPKDLCIINNWPLTLNGKIYKKQLLEYYLSQSTKWVPTTSKEIKLFQILEQVTSKEQITYNCIQHLSSLAKMRLVNELQFNGVDIDLISLLDMTTVNDLLILI